jgi:hypothetical protein
MFLFLLFFIFLYLRFFLVKRHKTFFGFGFKSFSLDWLYFFFGFGFWLSVRNGLYFVFGFGFFYIFYFILATPPILFGLPHWSPPFIQSLKTNLFLFVIHSLLLLLLLLLTASFKSSSLVVVRRLFVPAKCVRIKKLCKTH